MKRDLDLIRRILLEVEKENDPPLTPMDPYTEEEVLYHSVLAIEAGLLLGQVLENGSGQPATAMIQRLTWKGHDFLDSARNQTIWNQAMAKIAKAGGSWTFEIVKELLVELTKKSLIS